MQKALILGFSILIGVFSFAQEADDSKESVHDVSFFQRETRLNKGRLIGVSSSIGTVWTGSIIGLGTIWYENTEPKKFQVFDDSRNWLQMDKAGHVYAPAALAALKSIIGKSSFSAQFGPAYCATHHSGRQNAKPRAVLMLSLSLALPRYSKYGGPQRSLAGLLVIFVIGTLMRRSS